MRLPSGVAIDGKIMRNPALNGESSSTAWKNSGIARYAEESYTVNDNSEQEVAYQQQDRAWFSQHLERENRNSCRVLFHKNEYAEEDDATDQKKHYKRIRPAEDIPAQTQRAHLREQAENEQACSSEIQLMH
ncbi:hypothetical protein SLS56_007311 [Neofusicoccum ribis]|uniref:Uncharacterized protein n=1 Tax=Neofusicoccum ribis TaxID=45134 RepID=A0ABR3SNF9_9PEZI